MTWRSRSVGRYTGTTVYNYTFFCSTPFYTEKPNQPPSGDKTIHPSLLLTFHWRRRRGLGRGGRGRRGDCENRRTKMTEPPYVCIYESQRNTKCDLQSLEISRRILTISSVLYYYYILWSKGMHAVGADEQKQISAVERQNTYRRSTAQIRSRRKTR